MNLMRGVPGAPSGTIVGVRPEHLEITSEGWALDVEAVELLGAERLVYARWATGNAGESVIVRIDEGRTAPRVGERIHVTARPTRIHHFDASTGRRL